MSMSPPPQAEFAAQVTCMTAKGSAGWGGRRNAEAAAAPMPGVAVCPDDARVRAGSAWSRLRGIQGSWESGEAAGKVLGDPRVRFQTAWW